MSHDPEVKLKSHQLSLLDKEIYENLDGKAKN